MKFCIVNNGVIERVVVSTPELASQNGWLRLPPGAGIGEPYPDTPGTFETLQQENKLLKAQLQAQTERSDFIEDCIAEMATQVYGGV